MKELEGTWFPIEAEIAGMGMLDDKLDATILTIQADRYLVHVGGLSDKGKMVLDLETSPFGMDITGVEGPNADKIIRSIFKFENDELIVCYNLNGGDRPQQFATQPGTFLCLIRYKRVL